MEGAKGLYLSGTSFFFFSLLFVFVFLMMGPEKGRPFSLRLCSASRCSDCRLWSCVPSSPILLSLSFVRFLFFMVFAYASHNHSILFIDALMCIDVHTLQYLFVLCFVFFCSRCLAVCKLLCKCTRGVIVFDHSMQACPTLRSII